jgi:hypothetical protein
MKSLTEEQVTKAVDYWAARVNGLTPDNGERANLGKDASTASLWMGMLFKKPTPEQLAAFRARLREVLSSPGCWRTYLFDHQQYLSVDYDPNYILREIAKETGICVHNFPFKTRMYFDEDGKVRVSEGYGADCKEI